MQRPKLSALVAEHATRKFTNLVTIKIMSFIAEFKIFTPRFF